MDFSELSPELQKKAKECKSIEDILALADELGEDLSEEDLMAISGGDGGGWENAGCFFSTA